MLDLPSHLQKASLCFKFALARAGKMKTESAVYLREEQRIRSFHISTRIKENWSRLYRI